MNNLTGQKPLKLYKIFDLFAFKSSNNSKFLGFWINSSQNKLSIVKVIHPRDKKYKFIELNIIKINTNEGSSEFLLKKNFENTITHQDFNYSFSEKNANFFIFDNCEVYNFSLIDKEERILNDMQNNRFNGINTFNLIYDSFNKFDLPQRMFIVFKLLANYDKLGIDIEEISEDKKIIYMIDSIINNYENNKKQYNHSNSYLDRSLENGCSMNENNDIKGNNNKNKQHIIEDYKAINYENLVHICNIFMKNKEFHQIYKIVRKFFKRYFNYINLAKMYSNFSEKQELFERIYSQTRFSYNIEKKILKLIDKIIVYCISNNSKNEKIIIKDQKENGQVKNENNKNIYENKDVDNQPEILGISNKEIEKPICEEIRLDKNTKNLEVLLDILKFNFSLQNRNISIMTINLIKKIFYSKLKTILCENNNRNKFIILDDSELEKEEELNVDESILEKNKLIDVADIKFYGNLLSFEILSKLFLKMMDYKKAIRALIYSNNFSEIFDLIKQKKFPLESVEYEFKYIIENFNTEQIISIMDMVYEGKIRGDINNHSFDLNRFLNLIMEINISKFDPRNHISNGKNGDVRISLAFNVFEVLESLIKSEKIYYFNDNSTSEKYLYYTVDLVIFENKNIEDILDNKMEKSNLKVLENKINIVKSFITNYKDFDYKKILKDYKSELFNYQNLNIILIAIYEILNEYKSIIDIQIDNHRDPEVSIRFIDSLDIFHNKKVELLEYLRNKIMKSTYLNPIKKYYFISLFEDGDEVKFLYYINILLVFISFTVNK